MTRVTLAQAARDAERGSVARALVISSCDAPHFDIPLGNWLQLSRVRPGDRAAFELPHLARIICIDPLDRTQAADICALDADLPFAAAQIYVIDTSDRSRRVGAFSLGASHVIDCDDLDRWTEIDWMLRDAAKHAGFHPRQAGLSGRHLDHALGACRASTVIQNQIVREFADSAIDYIATNGIASWIQEVQTRHQSTYQHSLLVAGLVSRFAVLLGLSHADVVTLTETGLLHDVGKARVPLEILDKPGSLTADEMDIVRKHPQWGHDHLVKGSSVGSDALDGVLLHHEFLDGSGYPFGLSGSRVGDVPRILTIADIYAALIEERAYKRPMTHEAATAVLVGMAADGKLDPALVRWFGRLGNELHLVDLAVRRLRRLSSPA